MERDLAAQNSVGAAFSDLFEMPPMEVTIGFVGILIFGLVLGALIYLPIAEKSSKLSLDRLSGEIIWRYKPDWIVFVLGCIVFLGVSFLLVSGFLRDF